MLSFLGLRKDSKKSPSERESDGFVFIGETTEEQRQKVKAVNTVQPSTNVIVQPSKSSHAGQSSPAETIQPTSEALPSRTTAEPQGVEAVPALSELLGDIPFTLAPHVLAMQAGVPLIPEFVLPRDVNETLASFCYDFTLENSVLREP
ncbi:UBAP1-MVB12-associated (UMA)-domain containing protein 1 [Electrophorus electricus]|uniref:UMA domain-containing protein n=1 Tax=Electrophorus electricus TaxID=8005 RepID=A0AAY5EU53_ELEEL|nr:UBAP1-MVB12-associated (UMA)-domain containing protein 1 [Electrophorus electricus]